jgi:hypothetical protein
MPNFFTYNLQNAGVKTSALVPDFPYGKSGGGNHLKNPYVLHVPQMVF